MAAKIKRVASTRGNLTFAFLTTAHMAFPRRNRNFFISFYRFIIYLITRPFLFGESRITIVNTTREKTKIQCAFIYGTVYRLRKCISIEMMCSSDARWADIRVRYKSYDTTVVAKNVYKPSSFHRQRQAIATRAALPQPLALSLLLRWWMVCVVRLMRNTIFLLSCMGAREHIYVLAELRLNS